MRRSLVCIYSDFKNLIIIQQLSISLSRFILRQGGATHQFAHSTMQQQTLYKYTRASHFCEAQSPQNFSPKYFVVHYTTSMVTMASPWTILFLFYLASVSTPGIDLLTFDSRSVCILLTLSYHRKIICIPKAVISYKSN